jgi:hypothetical protein
MTFGTTPLSTTVLGTNEFPVSAVQEPDQTNLTAVEGGPGTVDSNSNRTAPMSVYTKDGGNVVLGTSTDANTVASVMGRLTKIRDLLNATLAVTQSGTWNITNISGTISLPTGASTSAKQPSLGTAGTASSDVLTVQGITSMTPLKVDGSGVTQPVSGTITANAGTNLNTSLLALETGGNLASIKSDLDSLVTNTADLLADGDFLTTISTNTGNTTTQATSLNTVIGVKGDAHDAHTDTTAITAMQVLKHLSYMLQNPATATETNSASIKSDLDEIATDTDNLAGIKSDLDSLVTNTADLLADGDHLATIDTNTGHIPAKGTAVMTGATPVTIATDDTVLSELLTDTDNLATMTTYLNTLQGIVGSSKAAVKAASGDFADGALATLGAKADAKDSHTDTTAITAMQVLKQISYMLQNALAVSQSGTWTVQPGNTANTTAWLVQDVVASSGGAIPYHNITVASTNFANVKGAAAMCYGVDLSNTSGSAIFVKLYDKATTPGTGDTPKRTFQVPANGTLARVFPKGIKFASGFGWAATGAIADNDNTSIAANCAVDFDLNS